MPYAYSNLNEINSIYKTRATTATYDMHQNISMRQQQTRYGPHLQKSQKERKHIIPIRIQVRSKNTNFLTLDCNTRVQYQGISKTLLLLNRSTHELVIFYSLIRKSWLTLQEHTVQILVKQWSELWKKDSVRTCEGCERSMRRQVY